MQSCHISKACDKCVVSYVNSAKCGMMLTQLQMIYQLVGDDCLHYLPSEYHHRGENSPSHPCMTLLGSILRGSSLPLPRYKDISGSHHVLYRQITAFA